MRQDVRCLLDPSERQWLSLLNHTASDSQAHLSRRRDDKYCFVCIITSSSVLSYKTKQKMKNINQMTNHLTKG